MSARKPEREEAKVLGQKLGRASLKMCPITQEGLVVSLSKCDGVFLPSSLCGRSSLQVVWCASGIEGGNSEGLR